MFPFHFGRRRGSHSPGSLKVGGVIAAVFGVVFAIYGLYTMARISSAEDWKAAPGRITESHVTTSRSKGKTKRHFHATYEYVVDGRAYLGNTVAIGEDSSTSELTSRYPTGSACPVLYDPGKPSDCALEVGSTLFAWLAIGFGAVMAVTGVLSLVRGIVP